MSASTVFRALAKTRGGSGPRIVIAGCGALGRELRGWVIRARPGVDVVFLDDAYLPEDESSEARGIVGKLDASSLREGETALLAINDPPARERAAERFAPQRVTRYVDPTATIGDAALSEGCILLPFTLLSDRCRIGRHAIVNTYSSIGHDAVVGDFCTLSSYVCLTGRVKVGRRVFFGTGAKVAPDVEIGDDAHIGAGAMVLKNVAAGARVFGNPARQVA